SGDWSSDVCSSDLGPDLRPDACPGSVRPAPGAPVHATGLDACAGTEPAGPHPVAAGARHLLRPRRVLYLPVLHGLCRAAGRRGDGTDRPAPDRPRRAAVVPLPLRPHVPPPVRAGIPDGGGGGTGGEPLPRPAALD